MLRLGAGEFHVLDTPGHTQGSISMWIPAENKLVAGDTLFRDSIGRTDCRAATPQDSAVDSIQAADAAGDAVVVPGHGPNTTIGREKERNPFLQGF